LNTFVREIKGGEFIPIAYVGLNGEKLNGSVLLPVGYEKGKRYPLSGWPFLCYIASSAEGFIARADGGVD